MKKLLVILLVLGMVAPAMAAEWNFYGHARMNIGSYERSEEWTGGSGANWAASDGLNDDTDTNWALQSNSRIGANVKASDAVSGRFEFGTSSSNVATRLIYGVWNFGAGKLTVGQDYTPIDILYSNQIGAIKTDGDEDMLSTGMTYEGRQPQIKLAIQGFELALISPKTTSVAGTEADTTLPKIEVAYTFATDMFSIKPYLGYNAVEVEETGVADPQSEDITSMVYGLAFKVKLGPAYINGNVLAATNATNYGLYTIAPAASSSIGVTAAGDTEDADRMGGAIVVGFKVNDMVTLEAGYAMISDELEVDAVTTETEITTYYIQAAITLAPGVVITPEYGMMDLGDRDVTGAASVDQGELTYIAAKMQINF